METLHLEDGIYVIKGDEETFYKNLEHGFNYLKACNIISKIS